jgi:uncharacterized Zn-binding protein involved in type VI secretion
MPGLAYKDGKSSVACTDGVRGKVCRTVTRGDPPVTVPVAWNWDVNTTQSSNAGSGNVFANGIGVVRKDDVMKSHPHGDPCTAGPVNHSPPLDTYSPNVYANNKPIGRIGDHYDGDGTSQTHQITSGSSNVFAN